MNAHILLVEDDTDLRDVLAQTLRKAGYMVTDVPDGRQAIDILTQQTDMGRRCCDIVLTDIVMGEIDGIEVLNVARSLPDAPEVILLTGYGSLETAIEAVRNNAFDYINKPSSRHMLLERIAAALEHRRTKQRQSKAVAIVESLADFADATTPEHLLNSVAPAHKPPEALSTPQEDTRYLSIGEMTIDRHRQQVWFRNTLLHITRTEYSILMCLAEVPGRVVTFDTIVRQTHRYELERGEAHDLLRSHIRNLRKKVDRRYIVSVYGTGYMLAAPEQEGAE